MHRSTPPRPPRLDSIPALLAVAVLAAPFGAVSAQSAKSSKAESGAKDARRAKALPDAWAKSLRWRQIGPANMSGRIVDIAVSSKDPTTYWVATASGGLLKTTNNGVAFEHQFDREEVVSIGAIDIAQTDPKIVWVGTGENHPRNSVSYGNGVYKSMDGGKTWKHMGLRESFQIGDLVVHPSNPDIVYVGAAGRLYGPNEERGLYKTIDGGKSWKRVLHVDDKTGINDIAMHPRDPETMIVSTYERQRDGFDTNDPAKKIAPGSGIWRTRDGGATWEKLRKGLPSCKLGRCSFDYYLANPDVVFALVESEKIGMAGERVGWAGMSASDAEGGAKIAAVDKKSPAATAKLEKGDVVRRIGSAPVATKKHFDEAMATHEVGAEVEIEFVRKGEIQRARITLGKRPAPARSGGQSSRRSQPRRPFGTRLGGQVANVQKLQGKDGHEHGGLYRSDDGGTSWRRINSINPRPMYFSQVRVDPTDDKHLYVLGVSMSQSKDGGATFTSDAGRGVHSDQHALWIDPTNSKHMILGSDGGIYVTYDRCASWDHYNHVAIGQFYHVTTGPRLDYWVYGGLQDNGTWGAPNRSGVGPINEDWIRIGGGDGFVCRVDANDPLQVYYESQNGGTARRHLGTMESGSIRPRAPRPTMQSEAKAKAAAAAKAKASGAKKADAPSRNTSRSARNSRRRPSYRFNWRTPFLLSHHNSRIYLNAGNHVFKSLDRGNDLRPISPEITRTDRGSATALAESRRNPDVLYVGTDDGALWGTRDGGKSWQNLWELRAEKDVTEEALVADGEEADEVPGGALRERSEAGFGDAALPLGELVTAPRWVASLDASRHVDGRVYLCLDGHRSDDDRPHVFISEDYGATWKSIVANLPWGSTRVLREDRVNPDLLWCGTEFGVWASLDRGASWTRIHGENLPTVAVHEVAQHEKSGDIVLATHGRSLWVLDATMLRSIESGDARADAALFEPSDVVRWTSGPRRGVSGGARRYTGENPSTSCEIFYALGKKAGSVELTLHDGSGQRIRTLDASTDKGLHRITWDMRREQKKADRDRMIQRLKDRFGDQWRNYLRWVNRRAPSAEPGSYTVKLVVDGKEMSKSFELVRDPAVSARQFANWREAQVAEELEALGRR